MSRGTSIAIMNTKGGVGKSTLTLALAETLVSVMKLRVLVIDADPQSSVTGMLVPGEQLRALPTGEQRYSGELVCGEGGIALEGWQSAVLTSASDVDDADSLHLIPAHNSSALLERAAIRAAREGLLFSNAHTLIRAAEVEYDLVLVDCSPALTLVTEAWLQAARWHVAPVRMDYASLAGLGVLLSYRTEIALTGGRHSEWLGVIVNGTNTMDGVEAHLLRTVKNQSDLAAFRTVIPQSLALQRASGIVRWKRTFLAKYPGGISRSITALSQELLGRIAVDRGVEAL